MDIEFGDTDPILSSPFRWKNKSLTASPTVGVLHPRSLDAENVARIRHEQVDVLDQMNKMEQWAKSVERRSLELTRTNRQLRSAVDKANKDVEHQRAKAERQAELAVAAELARTAAEEEARRLRAKFARSDKGTALLKAARLKMELEACREKLAAAENALKDKELKVEAVKGEAKALREVLQQSRPQTARSELDNEPDQATCSLREQLAAAERRCWEAEAKLAQLPDLDRRCQEAEQRCGEAEEKLQALGMQMEQMASAQREGVEQASAQAQELAAAQKRAAALSEDCTELQQRLAMADRDRHMLIEADRDHERGSQAAWHDLDGRLAQAEERATVAEKELCFQVQATESLQGSVDTLAAERQSLQQRCRDLEADTASTTTEHLKALEHLMEEGAQARAQAEAANARLAAAEAELQSHRAAAADGSAAAAVTAAAERAAAASAEAAELRRQVQDNRAAALAATEVVAADAAAVQRQLDAAVAEAAEAAAARDAALLEVQASRERCIALEADLLAAHYAQAIQAAELAKRCEEKNELQMRLDESAVCSIDALSAARSEAAALQKELVESKQALCTAAAQLADTQQRLCAAEGTARETAVELGSAQEKCSRLERQVAEASQREMVLEEALAEVRGAAEKHSGNEQIHLEQSVAQAQQIIALNAQLQEASVQLRDAARQRERAAAQLAEAATQRERLDVELAAAAGEITHLRRQGYEHEEKVTALLQQLHGARDRLADAEAELAAMRDENIQLSGENAGMCLELENAHESVASAMSQRAAAEADVKHARAAAGRDISVLTARVEELAAHLEAACTENASLSHRLKEVASDNTSLQELGGARCDALTKHLEVNRAEKAALSARCDELAADVAALQDDLATAERRCDAAEASADAIAQASEEARAALEADVARLRADLDASARQVAGLQAAAAASDAQCADLAADFEAMTARLVESVSEAEAVEDRIRAEHRAEVAALQRDLEQAQGTVADMKGQLLAARCDLEELEASARGVHRSLQVAQSEADGLRGELAEALQTKACLEASLRQAEAEAAAREEDLQTCQERLELRSAEVRGVKSLLSSALQPRIPCKPLPRLISLNTAAAAKPSSRAATMERLRVPQGRIQRPATADASLLGAAQPSGFAGPKPVWRQSSIAAAVERRLRPVSSSCEDEAGTDAAACLGTAEGGPEPVLPAGGSRSIGNRNKGPDEGFGFAPTPSAGSITAGGCAPTRRNARARSRVGTEEVQEVSSMQHTHRSVPGEGPHPIIERVVTESLGPPAAEVLMERTHPSPRRRYVLA